jgi:hypothetical protein
MYVVNDIELLVRLSKHSILSYLTHRCNLTVSDIRLNDYSLKIRQVIGGLREVTIVNVEKEGFDDWIEGRRKYLSISDLSSIYMAHINSDAILLLSPEDQWLGTEAKKNEISYLQFDDFCIRMIRDERIIQLYNLIKAA